MSTTLDKSPRTAPARKAVRLSPANAGALFDAGIAPRLRDLEKKHRAQQRRPKLIWAASIALALMVAGISQLVLGPFDGVLLAVLVGGGTKWALSRRPRSDLRLAVRQQIFKPLCDAAGITYALAPVRSNAKSFASLGLLDDYNAARAQNQLTGSYRDVGFVLNDALLMRKSEDSTAIVFRGLLSVFELSRAHRGHTLVLKNGERLAEIIDGFAKRPEAFQTGNPEFEQRFSVYASDADEARSVLTPDFLERLVTLERKLGYPLQLAFTGTSLLMSVALTAETPDVADLDQPFADPRRLEAAMIRFRTIFDSIDALQLAPAAKVRT